MTETAAHPVTYALGTTLVQFLWQGAAAGVITALVLAAARRAAPSVRYAIACAGLLALASLPLITFVRTFAALTSDAGQLSPALLGLLDGADVAPPADSPLAFAWLAPFALASWSPAIVIGWGAGVLLLTLRLLVGWRTVTRLHRGGAPGDEGLTATVARLEAALGMTQAVRLVRSALVEVPAVVGWLRPAIVVPASALAGLSPSQFEAIIAHELAHIRRRDHLVNAVQNVVETLLFYHPAVWWVSRHIRVEREHCCDDVALSVSGTRVEYAQALARLEEARHGGLALSVSAADGSLLSRIRRVLGHPAETERRASAPLVVCGALAVLALAIGARDVQTAPASATPARAAEAPRSQSAQTSPGAQAQIVALEETYRRARLANDTAALERLLDAAFVGGFSADSASNRAQWLSRLGASRISSLVTSSREINMDDGAAVVRGTEAMTVGGTSVQHRYVRAWKLGASGWTLVSHIQTLVPSEKRASAVSQPMSRAGAQGAVGTAQMRIDGSTTAQMPIYKIGDGVVAPTKIKDVKPIYPPAAKAAGIQGIVFLESIIDPQGNVTNLSVIRSSGSADLDQAAIDAVSQWRYKPTLLNGEPVSIMCTMTVNFTLKN